MTLKENISVIVEDYYRLKRKGYGLFRSIISSSFVILFWYRICYYLRTNNYPITLSIFPEIAFRLVQHYTEIQFLSNIKNGGGLHFPHYSCIVLAGKNCTIH